MQDPLQRTGKVAVDAFLGPVATLPNHEVSANHHVAHGLAAECKDPAVKDLIVLGRGDEGVSAVEYDKIGARADANAARLETRSLGPAGEAGVDQRAADRGSGTGHKPVAAAISQPLPIFQHAQLLRHGGCDMAVRADSNAPALAMKSVAG